MTLTAFRGELLSVPHDPCMAGPEAISHHADGLLVVEDGIVAARGDHATLRDRFADVPTEDLTGHLIVPGFVDTHIHFPQTDRIAAHGAQLLDWLDRHIFPAEARLADRAVADEVAGFFLDELLRNGTTSALVFATVHATSVDALFDAALARDMRIISGKVLMDRNAPANLIDTVETGRTESEALIARWRGRGRLGYAVTPRFALTSSQAQLESAAAMLAAHADVLLHSHLSENRAEIAAVADAFPDARDYLDVFVRAGLVGPRSVFAHGVHLCDDALGRMREAGAGLAHCPTSNLFLGSGLFDLHRALEAGVKLGLGTDVGAGTTFSMLGTMGEAYKVAQMCGSSLDPFRALWLATAGGAAMLGIGDKVGGLLPGQEADFAVIDPTSTPLLARRTTDASLHDRLFALQILADDRAIARTYVAGRLANKRQMTRRIIQFADPFLLLLVGVVLLATLLPARGDWFGVARIVTNAGIVLLFFLHGARLSRAAIIAGATHWRLHVAVLATSFVIFPLIGLGFAQAPAGILAPAAAAGIIYLSVLPSTVQSSIAFTAVAGGNVAAAVCSASFSNLLGTVVTPLWVAALLTGRVEMGAGSTLAAVQQIALLLLLPFLLGHLSRPLTAAFIQHHAKMVSKVDRGSIMLVVYTAFSAAVNDGLWRETGALTLAQILVASILILALILAISWGLGKAMGLNRADAIVLLFCGSKKSLASGVPMAAVLFPAGEVGMIILPIMIFHQIQLMVCAVLARGFARRAEKQAPQIHSG